MPGADVIFELQQIGVDLLQQFFGFVPEVRDELRFFEQIVAHLTGAFGPCHRALFDPEDREQRTERAGFGDQDELAGDFAFFVQEALSIKNTSWSGRIDISVRNAACTVPYESVGTDGSTFWPVRLFIAERYEPAMMLPISLSVESLIESNTSMSPMTRLRKSRRTPAPGRGRTVRPSVRAPRRECTCEAPRPCGSRDRRGKRDRGT